MRGHRVGCRGGNAHYGPCADFDGLRLPLPAPKVFRIYAECGSWRVASAEPAEGETEYTFTVPALSWTPGPTAFGAEPPSEPRVTREMVIGRIINAHYNEWFPCALCGAGLPTSGGVRQSDANIEAHRAWHDSLARLLEAR
jgi:hypothetical protein